MIQASSPTVLYINKFSVLVLSILLVFLWLTHDSFQSEQELSKTSSHSLNISTPKYLEKSIINPFLRSENIAPPTDFLPTVTALQKSVPAFSSLELKLHGIVFQRNQKSYAMISMQGAIQEIYSVNGEISEGLFITNITKKRVELDYFGKRHLLVIDATIPTQTHPDQMNEDRAQFEQFSFDQQIEYIEVDKHRNPIRLFMIRRPYAVYKDGQFQGYKIMPGSNADQFKRLGFQSGDIITYLNGIEFTGPGYKEFVINQLTHAMHIDLNVLRDNEELSIQYGF